MRLQAVAVKPPLVFLHYHNNKKGMLYKMSIPFMYILI